MKHINTWFLFLLLFFFPSALLAQQIRTITGKIQTVENGKKVGKDLPYANVVILEKKDSSFVKGAATDEKGNFRVQFPVQKGKNYLLKFSSLGMETAYRALNDTASVLRLGTIQLNETGINLKETIVTAQIPEVKMEGDTTIINADAYPTPEGSYLQDLVKRIPGLEYDEKTQSLSYNGTPIREINVNGESFFSGNHRIALENLPADFIGKIKVYNKRSETERATGMDDGAENFVLDLQTKEEFNKTLLASASAGYGNYRKKELEGQFNFFRKGGENLSLMLRSSNTNQNTTYKDNLNRSLGVNFTRKFGSSFSLNGNIQQNLNRNGGVSSTYHEQYLSSGNQYSFSSGGTRQEMKSFLSNLNAVWEIDKQTQFNFFSNMGLNRNESENNSVNATFNAPPGIDLTAFDPDLEKIPDSIRLNNNDNRVSNTNRMQYYNGSANFTRRLNEKGSNLSLSLTHSNTTGTGHNFSVSRTTYFQLPDAAGNDSVLHRNQYQRSPQNNHSWGARLAFTQPLGEKTRLQFSYQWNTRKEQDYRDTYDLSVFAGDEAVEYGKLPAGYTEGYTDSLSNRSSSRTQGHTLGLRLNYNDRTWNLNFGFSAAPEQRTIDRRIGKLQADTTLQTCDLRPSARAEWRKKDSRLSLNYNGGTSQPSLSALIPLTDNSDPLYITRGNTGLKQSFNHNLQLNLHNPVKGWMANIGWGTVQNSITQAVLYNEQTGGRETYPVNINGNWNLNTFLLWNKRKGLFSFQLNGRGFYSNNVSLVNENRSAIPERSRTRSSNLGGNAQFGYQPRWGGLYFSSNNFFQQSVNSLTDSRTHTRNYSFRLEGYGNFPFGLSIRSDASYHFRNGTNLQGNDNDEILWNVSALWRFLKKKQAELSINWIDILADQKNYERNSMADGFYERHTQLLQGYFLITFKYNLRIMKN